jgi:ABC-type multidrug transport system ATPase subunit
MDIWTDSKRIIDAAEFVIRDLGLSVCADTHIRDISGGEKRRVTIGKELISDPDLLFLDEPTSGLDSFQAQSIMQCLQRLSKSGRIIITAVHQPRSSIFRMFDKLLLLSEGSTIYFGRSGLALAHFAAISYRCPENFNPADFFLDLLSYDTRTNASESESRQTIFNLAKYWFETNENFSGFEDVSLETLPIGLCTSVASIIESKEEVSEIEEEDEDQGGRNQWRGFSSERMDTVDNFQLYSCALTIYETVCKWFQEFTLLLDRSLKNDFRNYSNLGIQFSTCLFFAIIIALMYTLKNSQNSIQDRKGLLFFVTTNIAFLVLSAANAFVIEKPIVRRERLGNAYSLSAYFVSKFVSSLLFYLVLTAVYGTIVYWGTGLQSNAKKFGIFIGLLFLIASSALSLAFLVSVISPSIDTAQAIGTPILIVFVLFGGFYINISALPPGSFFVQYVSFVAWGFKVNALPPHLIQRRVASIYSHPHSRFLTTIIY